MTPDYSVVIPAYNEESFLPETLACVKASMGKVGEFTGEVIVVDNNSTDRTADVAADRGLRVVFEEHRQIARARNAGAAAARGRYLIFVDADTHISPTLLRRALSALDTGRVCGGGTVIIFDRKVNAAASITLWFWRLLSKRFHWAAGSFVFCRREAFAAIGGFDERFYASEEIHFSQALKRWAKRNRLRVVVLDEPAITSSRKLDWFTWGQIARTFLRLGLNLSLLRNREACRFWYDRPKGGGG